MAQLWGGRFTKETDQLVYNFNASITFDKRFYKQDIKGSLAHVAMLAKQGILTEEEKEQNKAAARKISAKLKPLREDLKTAQSITERYPHILKLLETERDMEIQVKTKNRERNYER